MADAGRRIETEGGSEPKLLEIPRPFGLAKAETNLTWCDFLQHEPAPVDDLDKFNEFGFFLGTAFQIQDDVLNQIGSRERYGKEIAGDLYEGKRTLMLTHLFERSSPQERRQLQGLLGRPRTKRLPREIDWVYDLLRRYGSIEFAQARARELLVAAEKAFGEAYESAPESEDKTFLARSVRYMIDRRS